MDRNLPRRPTVAILHTHTSNHNPHFRLQMRSQSLCPLQSPSPYQQTRPASPMQCAPQDPPVRPADRNAPQPQRSEVMKLVFFCLVAMCHPRSPSSSTGAVTFRAKLLRRSCTHRQRISTSLASSSTLRLSLAMNLTRCSHKYWKPWFSRRGARCQPGCFVREDGICIDAV
ncbi:uncharacterized protein BDW70DRAFT_103719 [Aspergillus foveolatus]|uniref:uncharacterized protein n=1 Tax=Aspergillus foveolatus TaxID=210207 RepID=UPI003CCE4396